MTSLFNKCERKPIAASGQVETNVSFDSNTEHGFSFAKKTKEILSFFAERFIEKTDKKQKTTDKKDTGFCLL